MLKPVLLLPDLLAFCFFSLVGLALGVLARVWVSTLRVRVVMDPALDGVRDRPWVMAFWHGTQWPLLAWHRGRRTGERLDARETRAARPTGSARPMRQTVVLVSLSRDGSMQARALWVQGLRVVRGSSSRGGVRGLAALVRAMRRDGADAAFAVDGPRGPRGVVKGGAVAAARAAGAVLVPMTGAVRRGVVLSRAWDRFAIAWPFTRVDVTLGRPIDPGVVPDARAEVEKSLALLNAELAS